MTAGKPNYRGFHTTFLACFVAALSAATPVLANEPATEEGASLPAELAQAPAIEATALPAEPPEEDTPKAAADTPAVPPTPPGAEGLPPPARPRMISGPVTPSLKYNDLMTAVIYGDPKTVEQLLALGKWPDKPDSRGSTALMVATMLGDAASSEALLKAGANPNRPGPGGDTATSIARERRDGAVLKLLQRYGGK